MKFVLLALVASALVVADATPSQTAFKNGKQMKVHSKAKAVKKSHKTVTPKSKKNKAKDEPEYVGGGTGKPFGMTSSSEAAPAGSSLEPVQDYIDYNSLKAIRKASTVLLEVDTKTYVDPFAGMHKAGYADATLVDDLEESMKHLNKGEKRVSNVNSVFVALEDEVFEPEEPPRSLPKNLKKAFNKAAHAYEKQFQAKISKINLPHPSKYLTKSILLELSNKGEPSAEGAEGATGAAGSTPLASMTNTGATDASMTADGNFLDPYSMVTPATLSMGTQYAGGMGMGMGGGVAQMGAQYYGSPGLGGIGTIPAAVTMRNNMMGVVAPSPPVRPDGLPPPPYVQPDVDDDDLNGSRGRADAAAGEAPAAV